MAKFQNVKFAIAALHFAGRLSCKVMVAMHVVTHFGL